MVPSPSPHNRSVRLGARTLASFLFVVAVSTSCSTLSSQDIAADGDESLPTTSYVPTPPTSAPATTAPSTTEAPTETTAPSTTEAPTETTAPPTTEAPTTTAAPTTAAPTTAAPTTAAPTTAAPTTAAPTTVAPEDGATTQGNEGELEALPYTGPREAVLFGLIGLAMIVTGRTVLDLFGFFSRFTPTGERLPPR